MTTSSLNLQEILQFTDILLRLTICMVYICFVMTLTNENQAGRNEFWRGGSSLCLTFSNPTNKPML